MMNAGAVLLRRSGAGLEAIREVCGVSVQSASNWRSGAKKPSREAREKLAAAYDIPASAWDEDAASYPVEKPEVLPSPPESPSVSPLPMTPGGHLASGAAAKARILEQRIAHAMRRLDTDKGISLKDEAEIVNKLSQALERLAKLNGELEFTNARVLQLPFWRRIVEVSSAALTPFPDAALAFAKAVEGLEIEASRAA
jgi:transcriptional regulator with XRE-family HTH domain